MVKASADSRRDSRFVSDSDDARKASNGEGDAVSVASGRGPSSSPFPSRDALRRYIALKRIADGLAGRDEPIAAGGAGDAEDNGDGDVERLLEGMSERLRLLGDLRCPADLRIERFLDEHFRGVALPSSVSLRLPSRTLVLDREGLARELSLPENEDEFANEHVNSYRVKNGVLHNPRADRRTTQGTFHVTEGGLPIPADKNATPKRTFAILFAKAFQPPRDLLTLPFAARESRPPQTFVSLLIRPLVAPEVPGVMPEQRMETRFFAPAGLISNLDFVESIFGNAGDPFLAENDSALDVEHWTGHTGCVILAPHLCQVAKRDAGLPRFEDATERQRRDGMCWRDESELYNDGQAFKLTCRTESGVIVTLIADNYYGYCKKEVKTQISYAANLLGNVEEEHAGGAIAFASFNLGDEFQVNSKRDNHRTFPDVSRDYAALMDAKPEGYGVDKNFPDLIYIPENAFATLREQRIVWKDGGLDREIPLLPGKIYMAPSGYRLQLEKHPAAPSWRLIGTAPEGVSCHKPCTVSGGGKSEISKSLNDYMIYGPVFVTNLKTDLDLVQNIFDKDFSARWRPGAPSKPDYALAPSRKALDPARSLGSLIKLLTPSQEYTDEYNAWLESIPNYIYSIIFIIKRFQKPDWGDDWRKHFTVDIVNGFPGHELKYKNRKLVGAYLRVGLDRDHNWRTFKLRQDFSPAVKVATQDDISASVVVPARRLSHLNPFFQAHSCKIVANCERRLFQRPDDAVHRGLDRQAEADLSRRDNFISNFEPITAAQAQDMVKHAMDLDQYTEPMQALLREAAAEEKGYVVCSSRPRLVDGKPTKNPRYLQLRQDLSDPLNRYAGEMATRMFRAVPADKPVYSPVNAVLFGRRNNPPEPSSRIRGLAVYNPLHFQELPELFMDFIASLTGKSPSTTGAGSEGALTKGPFNALPPIIDLNAAMVSYLLTGLAGFSSAAGHIGPSVQVDHDISYLIPEIWCRLSPQELEPRRLVREGMFERMEDYAFRGETIMASRLGYRMTHHFVRGYFGRVFDNPSKVFDEAILRPETQDPAAFADGVKYICEAHQRVARMYFEDGSIKRACPPLRALLTIMAEGTFEGKDAHHPEIRRMFTLEALLRDDWYRDRLKAKQARDQAAWTRRQNDLRAFLDDPIRSQAARRLRIVERLAYAQAQAKRVASPEYLDELQGMLGLDPSFAQV